MPACEFAPVAAAGADLASLRKLPGHSRPDSAAIHLHVGPQQLREAVEGHPPAQ